MPKIDFTLPQIQDKVTLDNNNQPTISLPPLNPKTILPGSVTLGEFADYPKYDIGKPIDVSQEDWRGQQQGRLEKAAYGAGRFMSKFGLEVNKGFAYAGALGEAVFTDKPLYETLSNSFLHAADFLGDEVKEALPVFYPKDVRDGDLLDNIFSASFYASEGADAFGYLVSAMAPASLAGKLGMGARLATMTGLNSKIIGNMGLGALTAYQTATEAMAEVAEAVKTTKPILDDLVARKKITPEEADRRLKQLTSNVGWTNAAVLVGPNLLMNKWLLGRFSKDSDSVRGLLNAESATFKAPAAMTFKETAGSFLKKSGLAAFTEGFWEEGIQGTATDLNNKLALSGRNPEMFDYVREMADEYIDKLQTTDQQKAIFMGWLVGSAGAIGGTMQDMQKRKDQGSLAAMLERNRGAFDANVSGLLYEENGETKLNMPKAIELFESDMRGRIQSQLMDAAAISGKKDVYDFLFNKSFTQFVTPFLEFNDGGKAVEDYIDLTSKKLIEGAKKLDPNFDQSSEMQFISGLKSQVKELQKDYKKYSSLIDRVQISDVDQDRLSAVKQELKGAAVGEASYQKYLNQQIAKIEEEMSPYGQMSDLAREVGIESEKEFTKIQKEEIRNNRALQKKYKDELALSVKRLNSILDKDQIKKRIEDTILQEEALKNSLNNVENEVKDTAKDLLKTGTPFDDGDLDAAYKEWSTTGDYSEEDVTAFQEQITNTIAELKLVDRSLLTDEALLEQIAQNKALRSFPKALEYLKKALDITDVTTTTTAAEQSMVDAEAISEQNKQLDMLIEGEANASSLRNVINGIGKKLVDLSNTITGKQLTLEHLNGLLEDATLKIAEETAILEDKIEKATKKLAEKNDTRNRNNVIKLNNQYREVLTVANDIKNRVNEVSREIAELEELKQDYLNRKQYYTAILEDSSMQVLTVAEITRKRDTVEKKLSTINKLIDSLKTFLAKSLDVLNDITDIIVKRFALFERFSNKNKYFVSKRQELGTLLDYQRKGFINKPGEQVLVDFARLEKIYTELEQSVEESLIHGDVAEEVHKKQTKNLEDLQKKALVYQRQIRFLNDLLIVLKKENAKPAPVVKEVAQVVTPIVSAEITNIVVETPVAAATSTSPPPAPEVVETPPAEPARVPAPTPVSSTGKTIIRPDKFKGALEFLSLFLPEKEKQNVSKAAGSDANFLNNIVRIFIKENGPGAPITQPYRTDEQGNPILYIARQPRSISIKHQNERGETIVGYLPYSGQYLDGNKQTIDIQGLTEAEYQRLFSPSASQTLASFKSAHRTLMAFEDYLDANEETLKKSPMFSKPWIDKHARFHLSTGEYELIPETSPMISADLFRRRMTVTGNKPFVVVMQPTGVENEDGSFTISGYAKPEVLGASTFQNENGEPLPWVDQVRTEMRDIAIRALEHPDPAQRVPVSNYAMIVDDPGSTYMINGKPYTWIFLHPKTFDNPETFTETLAKNIEDLTAMGVSDARLQELKRLNKELSNEIYIPSTRGMTVGLSYFGQKSGKVSLKLEYFNKKEDIRVELITDVIPTSYKELIEALEAKRQAHKNKDLIPEITERLIRQNISKQTLADIQTEEVVNEMMKKLGSLVSLNVKKNKVLSVAFHDLDPVAPLSTPTINNKPPEPPAEGVPDTNGEDAGSDSPPITMEVVKEAVKADNAQPVDSPVDELAAIDLQIKQGNITDPIELAKLQRRRIELLRATSPKIAYSISTVPAEKKLQYDKAVVYLKSILPSWIGVEELDQALANMGKYGTVFGKFMNDVIYLNSIDGQAGTEYHEAFHAVFRTLLSNEEITQYREMARRELINELKAQGKTLNDRLIEFRTSSPDRVSLTETDLKNLLYEEHMADRFMNWKKNKKEDGFFTKLWNKLVQFFEWLSGERTTLDALFDKIDQGYYKNLSRKNNITDRSNPALALIPNNRVDGIDVYESIDDTTIKVNTIIALTFERISNHNNAERRMKEENPGYVQKLVDIDDKNQREPFIDRIMDNMINEYMLDHRKYKGVDLSKKVNGITLAVHAMNTQFTLSNPDSIKALKDMINHDLDKFKLSGLEEMIGETDKNETDPEKRRDINHENIGGHAALSKEMRQYLGLTTYEAEDRYGIPRVRAIDARKAYDGISRGTANCLTEEEVIEKMRGLQEFGGVQTKAFIDKFFADLRATVDSKGNLVIPGKAQKALYQRVIKAFNLNDKNHNQIGVKFLRDGGSETNTFFANQKNVEHNQRVQWATNYTLFIEPNFNNAKIKADTLENLKSFMDNVLKSANPVVWSREVLTAKSTELVSLLSTIGIDVSIGYAKYILLSNPLLTEKLRVGDAEQYKHYVTFKEDVSLSHAEFLDHLTTVTDLIRGGKNPFRREMEKNLEGEYVDRNLDAVTRLEKIAGDNAIFDETVSSTSFQSAEGKSLYGLQQATYETTETLKIARNESYYRSLLDDEYLKTNYLAMSEEFELIRHSLKVEGVDGMYDASDAYNSLNKQDGVVFGSMKPRDLMLYQLSLALDQKTHTFVTGSGKDRTTKTVVTAPMIISVMETSSSSNVVRPPVIKDTVTKDGISTSYKEAIYNEIVREFNRIQSVRNETDPDKKWYGYHTPAGDKPARGLDFWIMKKLLTENNDGRLYNKLKNGETTPEQEKEELMKMVDKYLRMRLQEFLADLQDMNLIAKTSGGAWYNVMLDRRYEGKTIEGQKKAFETADFAINLSKTFLSNYLNNLAYNQLMIGDPAFTVDGEQNYVKRNKFRNAAGPSLYSKEFPETTYAVFEEPKEGKTNIADAQSYGTVNFFRKMFDSLGRLDAKSHAIYDKLDNGEELTFEDVNYLKKRLALPVPQKTAGGDRNVNIKTSTALIHERLVGYTTEDGLFKPIPGQEKLFDLFQQMRAKNIDLIMPPTAMKRAIKSVSNNLQPLKIDNNFVRLQMENPSNKTNIKYPTQVESLLPFELEGDKGKDQINRYKSIFTQIRANNYELAMRLLKNVSLDKNNPERISLDYFRKIVMPILEESGASDNMLAFFAPDGKFNVNLPSTVSKARELFTSHFKGSFSLKIPGYKTTLMSDFGMHLLVKKSDPDSVITLDVFHKDPEKYAAMYKKGELVVRKLQERTETVNGEEITYAECLIPAHFAEQFGLTEGMHLPEELRRLFGNRIPASDKHSMTPLKIVGILPAAHGSTLVLPASLIDRIGHDFDVDAFYVHRPAHYVVIDKKGDPILRKYGNKDTETKFEQYIHYITGTRSIMDLFQHNLEKHPSKVQEKELAQVKEFKIVEKSVFEITLKQLGYPTNQAEFEKHNKEKGEINNMVLFNEMLETSRLLWSMSDSKLRNTPESDEALKEVATEIAKFKGKTAYTDLAEFRDPFTMNGINAANARNRAGSVSIGAAVNSAQAFTVLHEHDVKLNKGVTFTVDGVAHNDFRSLWTRLEDIAKDGKKEVRRVMDNLSTMIVGATDSGKTNYPGLLNLDIDSLSVVCMMMARGMPLRTAVHIANLGSIKTLMKETAGAKLRTNEEMLMKREQIIKDTITFYAGEYKTLVEKHKLVAEEDRVFEGIRGQDLDLKSEEIIATLKEDKAPTELDQKLRYLKVNIQALELWTALSEEQREVGYLNALIKLNKGIEGTSEASGELEEALEGIGYTSSVGKDKKVRILKEVKKSKDLKLDYSSIIENDPSLKARIEQALQFVHDSQEVFIDKTPLFVSIRKMVRKNMLERLYNAPKVMAGVERDLSSYLIISAYKNFLQKNKRGAELQKLTAGIVFKQLNQNPTVDRQYTPEDITELATNEIFVFGSNEGSSKGGKPTHGRGAALDARQKFGAIQGQTQGLQGKSYAVVTKKYWDVEKSSTLQEIGKGIQTMLLDAKAMPSKRFLVTKLGSSLAGYSEGEIKGLFERLKDLIPDNVVLPKEYEVREATFDIQPTSYDAVELLENYVAKYPELRENPFIRAIQYSTDGDVSTISYNTRSTANKTWERMMADGFTELYKGENGKFKPLAQMLFNYVLVKDSLQYKNNSYIALLPPFIFKEISDSLDSIAGKLSQNNFNDADSKSVFGMTRDEVIEGFNDRYFRYVKNNGNVTKVKDLELTGVFSKTPDGKFLDVNMLHGMVKTFNATATRNTKIEEDTGNKETFKKNMAIIKKSNVIGTEDIIVKGETRTRLQLPMYFGQWTRENVLDEDGVLVQNDVYRTYKLIELRRNTDEKSEPFSFFKHTTQGTELPLGISARYEVVSSFGNLNSTALPYGMTTPELEQIFSLKIEKAITKDTRKKNQKRISAVQDIPFEVSAAFEPPSQVAQRDTLTTPTPPKAEDLGVRAFEENYYEEDDTRLLTPPSPSKVKPPVNPAIDLTNYSENAVYGIWENLLNGDILTNEQYSEIKTIQQSKEVAKELSGPCKTKKKK